MVSTEISAKILSVNVHGQSQADIEVELSFDGKVVGTKSYRVNRVGKEAEEIAVGLAKRDGAQLAPPPTPKSTSTKPPTKSV